MKSRILVIAVALVVVFVVVLCLLFSVQKKAAKEMVEYDILSSRLVEAEKSVVVSEGKPCDETRKSPCVFKTPFPVHECEMVLSGGDSVAYPECSKEKVQIVSRIEAIKSDEDLPYALKEKIAEHLGVKLGKETGGGLIVTLGPNEFDDSKFKAQCVVGIAAIVEEYQILYSVKSVGTYLGDAVERIVTVRVYKDAVPLVGTKLVPIDGGKTEEDSAYDNYLWSYWKKSYSCSDSRLAELKGRYEKMPTDGARRLAKELSSVWRRMYYTHYNKNESSDVEIMEIAFNEDGTAMLTVAFSGKNKYSTKFSYEILRDKEQKKFPGRKPLVLLSMEDDNTVLPLVDVAVDYDSRVPQSQGKVLKFNDVEGDSYVFVDEKRGGSSLIEGIDAPSILQAVLNGKTFEYEILNKYGVAFKCIDKTSKRAGYVMIGIFKDENEASELFKRKLSIYSSLKVARSDSTIGNECVVSGSWVLFRRLNVLIDVVLDEKENETIAKKLDEIMIVHGLKFVRRGFELSIPRITGFSMDGARVMAVTEPPVDGYTAVVDGMGQAAMWDSANAICFATKECVMAAPFKCDGKTLKQRYALELAKKEEKAKLAEEDFNRQVEILTSAASDDESRKNAILILGNSNDERAVPILIAEFDRLNKLENPFVLRCMTIRAFGMLRTQKAVERLATFLRTPPKGNVDAEDEDSEAIDRREAVYSLGKIGGETARKVLEEVPKASKEYRSVRESAVAILRNMK